MCHDLRKRVEAEIANQVLVCPRMCLECMDLPIESARLPGWVENEVRESILRDRNRTCVVQWELFNELKRPVLIQMLRPMSLFARRLDPTRLILDESGGWAHGANMYLPYESEPTKFNDIHDYPGPHIGENEYDKLLLTGSKSHAEMRAMGLKGRMPGRNVVKGLMTFISELGYGSLPDLVDNNKRFADNGSPIAPTTIYHQRLAEQHKQVLKESGFSKIYPGLKKFCLDQQRIHGTANKRMMEAVRCNPNVKGYCVHALTAGNWIMGAGLLDLYRNPKTYAYEGTKAANQPRILSIRVRPRNVYAKQGTTLEVIGVNELDQVEGSLELEVVSAEGKAVLKRTAEADMASGIAPLFSEKIDTKALAGTYTVKARVKANDGSLITRNEDSFDVFSARQLMVPKKRIAVLDTGSPLKSFLKQAGIEFVDFNTKTDPSLPVFVSRSEARKPAEGKRYQDLIKFIKAGGTAVYLEGGGFTGPWGMGRLSSPLLPVRARSRMSIGTWNGIAHLVHDHPIFSGLPVNCMMGSVYENIWAQRTMIGIEGDVVAGSIGFDWFPEFDLSKRHYYGPGDTWWGGDLTIVEHGKGRCIVSQLRLVENLGKDPVADRIFYNLIRFTFR